jgi:YfiR/HmsC-like
MKLSEPKREDNPAEATQPFMRLRATPILSLGLVWLLASGGGRAQESPPTEYQLKAAFVLNFARFVEWPPAAFAKADSHIVLGILGETPFGNILKQTLQGKKVNGRELEVTKLPSSAAATNCHILFIGVSNKARLAEILKDLGRASLLTVGETDGFTDSGGMINFVPQGNKIRFQINEVAARSAGLKISSKLLSLAVR